MTAPAPAPPGGMLAVVAGLGRAWRAGRDGVRRVKVRRPRRRRGGGRRPGRRQQLRMACPYRSRGCRFQDTPRAVLHHLRHQCRHVPNRGTRRPGRGAGPFRGSGPRPAGGARPAASRTANLNQRITELLTQMGPFMEDMKALTAHIRRVGEAIDAQTLLELISMLHGLQAIGAAYAELIIDVTDHADVDMWVDPRALRHGWSAADQVTEALPSLAQVVSAIAQLYPGRLAAEQEADEGGAATGRKLNPDRMRPVA